MRHLLACAALEKLHEDAALLTFPIDGKQKGPTVRRPCGIDASARDLSRRSPERRDDEYSDAGATLGGVEGDLPSVRRPGRHRLVKLRRVGEPPQRVAVH